MTAPRQVLPDRFYMITRRCTQRQFLLRPDPELDNAFLYCLIVAALEHGIGLLHAIAMSNHHHTSIYDRKGTFPAFMQDFHRLLAKCVNWMRHRRENCWSSDPPSVVHCLERRDVINELVYAATNPVKDGLVESATDWPGVNTIDEMFQGTELRARRPGFFRNDGNMPAEVSITLEVPPQLGDKETFLSEVRAGITKREARFYLVRAILGRSVLGPQNVLNQSPLASPSSYEPPRTLRPRLAAQSKWARIEALQRHREFQIEYRRAWRARRSHTPIPFPAGTYWLHKFMGVQVLEPTLN